MVSPIGKSLECAFGTFSPQPPVRRTPRHLAWHRKVCVHAYATSSLRRFANAFAIVPGASREHEHGLYFLLSFTPLPIYPQDSAPYERALNLCLIQLQ